VAVAAEPYAFQASRETPWNLKSFTRSASLSSSVVSMPPSPVVMSLIGWKL